MGGPRYSLSDSDSVLLPVDLAGLTSGSASGGGGIVGGDGVCARSTCWTTGGPRYPLSDSDSVALPVDLAGLVMGSTSGGDSTLGDVGVSSRLTLATMGGYAYSSLSVSGSVALLIDLAGLTTGCTSGGATVGGVGVCARFTRLTKGPSADLANRSSGAVPTLGPSETIMRFKLTTGALDGLSGAASRMIKAWIVIVMGPGWFGMIDTSRM